MTEALATPQTTTTGGNGRRWKTDRFGLDLDLPRPPGEHGRIQGMPYRPVQFDADDLPTALRRAASWLQETELWLGEAVDVIAVRLDFFEDEPQSYAVKLLCAEDDLDGLTKATSAVAE